MNPYLNSLHPYPFEKLNKLFAGITPPADKSPISLSIGEPKHASPAFVKQALIDALPHMATYPTTKGILALREAISAWACRRFHLSALNPDTQVLPVNGTREALFAIVQTVFNAANKEKPYVIMPNPFYQIYEGAAFLAGASPYYVNCTAENNYLPDLDNIPAEVWQKTQLIFITSPGNPTGAVIPQSALEKLIALADKYNFVIASDECYSELYFDTPPVGLLEVAAAMGRHDYKQCLVFHSLSKRSNLPGLRSGFVAGDANILAAFLLYRTYHGSAMPVQTQLASIAAWQDEAHVIENRRLYQQKFHLFMNTLGKDFKFSLPDAGFYFWLPVEDDELFAKRLYAEQHITVLPGRYLSRDIDVNGQIINPGKNHVRIALVADMASCEQACQRFLALLDK